MRYVKQLARIEKVIAPPQIPIPEPPSEESLPEDLKILLEKRKNDGIERK